jgi:flagellar biosynthetic protein FliR
MDALATFLTAALLVSLRIVPTLAFAPPFTLLRIPPTVRVMIAVSFAAWIVSAFPGQTTEVLHGQVSGGQGGLVGPALAELLIGVALGLALQLAFAAILTVGRLIDLQAGFAFALLADPTNRSQLPLIGMIFAYCAGALFFLTDGPSTLLAIWSASVEHLPIGAALDPGALGKLLAFIGIIFTMALGAGGLILLVLFLIDLAIAFMSRTLPQMNVLFLGFQVKTIATLALLPATLAVAASLFLRMTQFALSTMLELV